MTYLIGKLLLLTWDTFFTHCKMRLFFTYVCILALYGIRSFRQRVVSPTVSSPTSRVDSPTFRVASPTSRRRHVDGNAPHMPQFYFLFVKTQFRSRLFWFMNNVVKRMYGICRTLSLRVINVFKCRLIINQYSLCV
jgi:hypothetical protein